MTWSSSDLAQHCLSDRARTDALCEAIRNMDLNHQHVLDIGSGTGVLALAALDAGASSVHLVELDTVAAAFLRSRARREGDRMVVIEADARSLQLDRIPDAILVELLDVWFLEEDFYPTLRFGAEQGWITESTKVLPSGYTWTFEVGRLTGESFRFGIEFPYYEWPHYVRHPDMWQLPTFEPAQTFDLGTQTAYEIATGPSDRQHSLTCDHAPEERLAFRLSGKLHLGATTAAGFPSLNSPVVIPAIAPHPNPEIPLELSYELGGGVASIRISAGGESLLPW